MTFDTVALCVIAACSVVHTIKTTIDWWKRHNPSNGNSSLLSENRVDKQQRGPSASAIASREKFLIASARQNDELIQINARRAQPTKER